ncbi:MAG: family metallopeptidase [Schumannella sp.]|nr:family metallopeptidase [Schumannella sp.]
MLLPLAIVIALVAAPLAPDPPREPGRWAWPVPSPHAVVRPFVAPPTAYARGHRGIDIRAGAGVAVRAPADGIVHFAGYVVDRPVLSIEHAGGVLSSFEPVDAVVAAGDPVRRGQVVGVLLAGHCAAPCLHLGARIDGRYVNPLLFLGDVPRAVLLPVRQRASSGAVWSGPGGIRGAGVLHGAGALGAGVLRGAGLLGAGVGGGVGLLQPLSRDVGVDLGGREARVTEQFLHSPQIRSPVEQVGGGRVP